MSMNVDKLFKAAAQSGLSTFEAWLVTEDKTSIQTFNGDVEVYTVAGNGSIKLRGVLDGNCGSFSSDRVDDEMIPVAIAAVKESAEYGQPIPPEFFVSADAYKYETTDTFHPALDEVPAEKLVELARTLDKKAHAADSRMQIVSTTVEYAKDVRRLKNSNGLDITAKSNVLVVVMQGSASDGQKVESGFEYEFVTDFASFDPDAFVEKFVDYIVKQFGGEPVKTGKYKVVYAPSCVASLLSPITDGMSAFSVAQHMSLIEGKVGEKAFSDLLTVEEKPIGSGPFCRAFDDEGVPCTNKTLIDKGVPTGYVYDLATGMASGLKSTGNGARMGSNVRPNVGYCEIAPGDKTPDELFEFVGDGLYITDISGIGTGLDRQSGSYSLQAAGYVIEKGKLKKPVSLITVAGNVMTDFANIIAVGNDSKLTFSGVKTPSLVISEVAVAGK